MGWGWGLCKSAEAGEERRGDIVAEVKGFWRAYTIAYQRQPAAVTITLVEKGEMRWRSVRQKRIKLFSQPYYAHCNKAQ